MTAMLGGLSSIRFDLEGFPTGLGCDGFMILRAVIESLCNSMNLLCIDKIRRSVAGQS